MSALGQLVFDLEGAEPRPALSRHVPAGAARLLRKLVADGLDPKALENAAELVVALDEWATS